MINEIATELVRNDPDATLWDFLHVWYEYLHGSFPVTETDEEVVEIIYLHLLGKNPTEIAKKLDINRGNVVAYLQSMDFNPWTIRSSGLPMLKIYEDLSHNGEPDTVCEMYSISRHIADKIGREYENAKRVLTYAN